ncbi:hypothetical protein K505DRAFT_335745 [Melanomma pulvis-pyrius CBS 109.77]|uniref:Uncharacterized protein n=1 Tax=Melanomma pulvis-pyrius CBS 109.77 TaxID=1314802 RepID=A0A6A6XIP8_9PLEO|nr:hypothetical protein K505DRAFT_335745 [Melanomma pulvis-pyrius CBS 109.77]
MARQRCVGRGLIVAVEPPLLANDDAEGEGARQGEAKQAWAAACRCLMQRAANGRGGATYQTCQHHHHLLHYHRRHPLLARVRSCRSSVMRRGCPPRHHSPKSHGTVAQDALLHRGAGRPSCWIPSATPSAQPLGVAPSSPGTLPLPDMAESQLSVS